jgi:hypothetical protein
MDYNLEDTDFKELVRAMTLSSKATFSYNPTNDDILAYLGKKDAKNKKDDVDNLSEK